MTMTIVEMTWQLFFKVQNAHLHPPDAHMPRVDLRLQDGLRLPDDGRHPGALFRHCPTPHALRPEEAFAAGLGPLRRRLQRAQVL